MKSVLLFLHPTDLIYQGYYTNTMDSQKQWYNFRKADIMTEAVRPADYNVKSIGHFGLFSRKIKMKFWPKIVTDLEAMASTNLTYNNPSLKKINL